MMGELIFRNLLHRPARTLIGVIAISVEVALVVLIVGLTSGLLTETAKRIEGIGADIMLQPPAASIFLGFSGSPMPIKIGDKIEDLSTCRPSHPLSCNLIPPAAWKLFMASTAIPSAKLPADLFFSPAATWRPPTTFWWMTGPRARRT